MIVAALKQEEPPIKYNTVAASLCTILILRYSFA